MIECLSGGHLTSPSGKYSIFMIECLSGGDLASPSDKYSILNPFSAVLIPVPFLGLLDLHCQR